MSYYYDRQDENTDDDNGGCLLLLVGCILAALFLGAPIAAGLIMMGP